jgi:RNA polymerase sigma-70 factor, ECF subfamily
VSQLGNNQAGDPSDLTPTLVARLIDRDPEAANLLNKLYRDKLVRFCWGYLGRLDQAEDAVQDICYKILESGKVPRQFRPWIYRIARNHCLNLLRERAGRHDDGTLPTISQIQDTLTGHLTQLVREEERSRLAALVRTLSVEQSEVLRLRYVENLSRSEIAEVLGLPETVVKSRIFEGLKTLREFADQLRDS